METKRPDIFPNLEAVHAPSFLIKDMGNREAEAEKVIEKARSRARDILEKEGYLGASRMLERLDETIELLQAERRRVESERRYYEFLSTRYNRPPFEGARVMDQISSSRHADPKENWHWRTAGGSGLFRTGGFLSSPRSELQYEPTDEELSRFGVNLEDLSLWEAPAFDVNLTWEEAVERLQDQKKSLGPRHQMLHRTIAMTEFRRKVLNNVLYEYEVFGDDVGPELTKAEAALGEGRALSNNDLRDTLVELVRALKENPDATAFRDEICPMAAEPLFLSPFGVQTRAREQLLPLFENHPSGLQLPTSTSVKDWQECLPGLEQLLEDWQLFFIEGSSVKT